MKIDIVKTLENIQEYCDKQQGCKECKFHINNNKYWDHCTFALLIYELNLRPNCWDMEKIKEILDE